MSINTLNSRLEEINEECEKEIQLKLSKFYADSYDNKPEPYIPSPQVIEALWFDLIAEKEKRFIREIALTLNKPNTILDIENTNIIKKTINDIFAESKYIEQLKEFYNKLNREASSIKTDIDSIKNKLDLIDSAYQEGISKKLHKTRENVLDKLNLYQKNESKNLSMFEQWKKYSTLSPLRALGTIFLLYCTSLLIALIIKSETFQKILEQFRW